MANNINKKNVQLIAFDSVYTPACFDSYVEEEDLLLFCIDAKYTTYPFKIPDGGVRPLRRAPKIEFYITNELGLRPIYRWGQDESFWQAGYPMPPILLNIADRIYAETGERVNHAIIIAYFDGTEQFQPPHKDKAKGVFVRDGVHTDMSQDGSFFVLSLGNHRLFTLQRNRNVPDPKPWQIEKGVKALTNADIVWQQYLAPGSMLQISASDNRTFYHAVHQQANAGTRFSIVFRTISTHVPIDQAAAAVANSDQFRFVWK